MKIVRTKYLPVRGFSAMNFLGILFVHPGVYLSQELINHERIHTAQLLEMGIIGFYIWYLIEWLVRLPRRGSAYRRLSMEREASNTSSTASITPGDTTSKNKEWLPHVGVMQAFGL